MTDILDTIIGSVLSLLGNVTVSLIGVFMELYQNDKLSLSAISTWMIIGLVIASIVFNIVSLSFISPTLYSVLTYGLSTPVDAILNK